MIGVIPSKYVHRNKTFRYASEALAIAAGYQLRPGGFYVGLLAEPTHYPGENIPVVRWWSVRIVKEEV